MVYNSTFNNVSGISYQVTDKLYRIMSYLTTTGIRIDNFSGDNCQSIGKRSAWYRCTWYHTLEHKREEKLNSSGRLQKKGFRCLWTKQAQTVFHTAKYLMYIYTSTKVKSHPVFFQNLYSFAWRLKEVESKKLFCNTSLWIKSMATIWVVLDAHYEIKWLVITLETMEITRTF